MAGGTRQVEGFGIFLLEDAVGSAGVDIGIKPYGYASGQFYGDQNSSVQRIRVDIFSSERERWQASPPGERKRLCVDPYDDGRRGNVLHFVEHFMRV